MEWTLYVLINDSIPIYVGVTSNIKNRLLVHRSKGKQFTNHLEIETFKEKAHAFAAERSIIKYLSVFGDDTNINGKYVNLESKKKYL